MIKTPNVRETLSETGGIRPRGKGESKTRAGKLAILTWQEPAVRKQFQILAVEQEKTQQALLAEAINMLFLKYGKPPIAS
jgi:hypothetical protein